MAPAAANSSTNPRYDPPAASIHCPPATDRTTVTARVRVCRREMYRPLRPASTKPIIHWFSATVVWAWRVKAATTAARNRGSRSRGGARAGMAARKRVASRDRAVRTRVSRFRLDTRSSRAEKARMSTPHRLTMTLR